MLKTYTTISGDRWDQIAYNKLGDEKYATRMMKLNPEYAGVFVFPAGVVLSLPEKEHDISVQLPPWKLVNR